MRLEKQNFIYFRVWNPILENPEYEGDLEKTTKKDKKYHGIGLKSIQHLAQKYDGYMSLEMKMGCFILEVLLPGMKTMT